ncbi:MAG: putative AlkP superfamily phosphohydrolase/phosphomutase [Myxococcota bacterium]|jgi:predicted AlkP superfamily phosphohydrolase/phosphomutase
MLTKRILALFAATLCAAAFSFASFQDTNTGQKVIVLGMDGMDAEMAADWMDAGELPNFSRLRGDGSFAEFMPANPAQSPVSWASINTGRNPGKHGIYDFIGINRDGGRRAPVRPEIGFQSPKGINAVEAGLPYAQMSDFSTIFMMSGALALIGAVVISRRKIVLGVLLILVGGGWAGYSYMSWQGAYPEGDAFIGYDSLNLADNFWVELDNAGVAFRGQGTIVSYPTEELQHGKLVAGLGAPDALGGLNSSAIYTTSQERVTSRKTVEPTHEGVGSGTVKIYLLEDMASKIYGPANATVEGKPKTSVDLSVEWDKGNKVSLTVAGVTQEVAINTWSDFYQVEFEWNAKFSTWALVRLWVEEREGELEIYTSPLQVDPEHLTPGNRTSWPPSFAKEIQDEIGRFETLGWACQTHAVKDAELSDDAFLADIEFTLEWRTKMLAAAVKDKDWEVLFHFFGTPDRICHMLMRHMDPRHPQYDEEKANRVVHYFGQDFKLKDSGLVIYKEMDKIVGWLLDEVITGDDVLMIVSDHGFDSFRRQVDFNAWLAQEGFLKLDNYNRVAVPLTAAQMNKSSLAFVDWNETQAYSIAIGKIYLNLAGREAKGMVSPEDADAVLKQIEERLYAMVDPVSGEKMVKKVYMRDDLYSGPYVHATEYSAGAAEITIDLVSGYRASWNVTGGGITLTDGVDENGDTIAVPGDFVSDNNYAWSGDHCGVDIHAVQGVFFSNKKTQLPAGDTFYDSTHLAPTVLDLLKVPVPVDYDSKPLTVIK